VTAEAPARPAGSSWTGRLRRRGLETFPPDELLPETQPAYVASWIYVFGVATVAALVVVIATGSWLSCSSSPW
jgi:hypothetical protein